MAKSVVKPCETPEDVKHPKGEHLSRVAYDDNEPPKNYIWCKPDGTYWKWNGVRWMRVMDFAEDCPHFPPMPPHQCHPGPCPPPPPPPPSQGGSGSITFDQLNTRLEAFRVDLFAQILSYFDNAGGGTDIGEISAYFNEYIEPRIRALEDAQSTYDDTALISRITSVDGRVTSIDNRVTSINNNITSLNSTVSNLGTTVGNLGNRVTDLENTRVTRDELDAALADVGSSSSITGLTTRVTNLETNSATKAELTEANRVTSAALNELNDRIDGLGNIDTSMFVTAEEVANAASLQL